MSDWNTYLNRLNLHGIDARSRYINNLKDNISKRIIDSPSFKKVTVNGIDKSVTIIDTDNDNTKKIKLLPNDDIKLGDIIVWNSLNWLVTSKDTDGEIYYKGQMKQCNYLLPFQNAKGEIIYRSCVLKNLSTFAIDTGTVISTPKQQYTVQLTLDDETKLLDINKSDNKANDNARRFLIDISGMNKMCSYHVTKRDVVTDNYGNGGVLNLSLEQDEHQDSDRDDLGIANYFTPTPSPTSVPSTSGTSYISSQKGVIYTTSTTIKIGGSIKYFDPVFKDLNNNVITGITPVWTLDLSGLTTEQQGKVTFTTTTTGFPLRCSLTVADESSLINKTITLKMTDDKGIYGVCQLNVQVVSLYG